MLEPEVFASIIVAILALVGTVFNAIMSRGKMNKNEAVAFESRLKDYEADQKLIKKDVAFIRDNMITEDQKECLLIVNERVNTILAGLGTFVPKDLKNPAHLDAVLDTLSDKAATGGWTAVISYLKDDLDAAKRADLLAYLEKISNDKRYTQRRHWATLYLGLLRLELDREDPVCVEAK